jgi:hypothetical protein
MTLDHRLWFYFAPGADGGNQNISLFYGYSSIIADFIDNGSLGSRPSINGFDNGDGILTMNSVGSVMALVLRCRD